MLDIIYYEIRMTFRAAYSWLTPLFFFAIVITLFPLAVGPDQVLLQKMAPGIIWVAALLATLLSIGNIFRRDQEDGSLDLILLSPYPLTLLVSCKIISHWLTHCLPLVLMSPVAGLLLHLSLHAQVVLVITLLLGTPVLILFGAMGAALIVGIRHHGLLLPVLIMPLYIPVLIFGTGALTAEAMQQPVTAYFAILTAIMLLCVAFAPLLTGMALRIGVNQ